MSNITLKCLSVERCYTAAKIVGQPHRAVEPKLLHSDLKSMNIFRCFCIVVKSTVDSFNPACEHTHT